MRKVTLTYEGVSASTRAWARRFGIPQPTLRRWLAQGLSLADAKARIATGGSIERIRLARTTHGQKYSRTYRAWQGMLARCDNPNVHSYPNYGGRGITVCRVWRKFERFVLDMGECPPEQSLDRIDNEGHYEPSNCRWATITQQANNRRTNRRLIVAGREMTVAEASREFAVKESTIAARLGRGLSGDDSVLPTGRILCRT